MHDSTNECFKSTSSLFLGTWRKHQVEEYTQKIKERSMQVMKPNLEKFNPTYRLKLKLLRLDISY